jgi:hypothetical protein
MVYVNSWQKYQEAAENLYANSPRKVWHPLRSFLEPLYASPPPCAAWPRHGQARTRVNETKRSFGWADGLLEDSLQRKMEIFGGQTRPQDH